MPAGRAGVASRRQPRDGGTPLSAVAAVISLDGGASTGAVVWRMLAAMAPRGADHVDVRHDGTAAVLGVGRHAWEMADGMAGGVGLGAEGDVVVACDGSLYYRAALRSALASRGIEPRGDAPAQLIAAAYRAWGDDCAAHLEGDFAFVLWDSLRRRVVSGRDFVGSRPLHYAVRDRCLIVASTIDGVLAHPGVPQELNLPSLAATAAGLFSLAEETCYRAVSVLPAGFALTADAARREPVVRRVWEPPPFVDDATPAVPFAAAAEELRRLLYEATVERLAPQGVTALSLSGGWDSPAVFGIGQLVLRDRGVAPSMLHPVSISFPEGDTGREDELIRQIAAFWGVEPSWVDIRGVPMFGGVVERAAQKDEPFAHPYAGFNSSLAHGAAATGAHVMLGGLGGDQLFHVEPAYLADLARRGRLLAVLRELRAQGSPDLQSVREWVVRPLLPAAVRRLVGRVRGGSPMRGYLERTLPPWIRPDFARAHQVLERDRAAFARRPGESAAAFESRWLLANPFYARITRAVWDEMLAAGVEERSPLFDERVVRFAATRPRRERRSGRETKLLLRAAVRGLLPDSILAPRPHKTGTMNDYFVRGMQQEFPKIAAPVFAQPLLAELGIVEPRLLQAAGARVERGQPEAHASALIFTLQVELWLRGRTAPAAGARPLLAVTK